MKNYSNLLVFEALIEYGNREKLKVAIPILEIQAIIQKPDKTVLVEYNDVAYVCISKTFEEICDILDQEISKNG